MANSNSSRKMVVATTTSSVVMDQKPDAWRDRLVIQPNGFGLRVPYCADGDSGPVYGWRGNRWRRLSARAGSAVRKSLG